MKKVMFSILFISFVFSSLFLFSSANAGAIPTRTGDYCKDEALEYLEKHFGNTVQVETYKRLGSGNRWEMYVKTNLCSNWFAFRFMGEGYNCTTPQYGSRVQFMTGVYGFGDCANLIH